MLQNKVNKLLKVRNSEALSLNQRRASSLTVSVDEDALRLDCLLRKHFPYLSYGTIQKLLRRGKILVAQKKVRANFRVSSGAEITILAPLNKVEKELPKIDNLQHYKEQFLTWIIYEDDFLLALNKPSGIPVQAGTGHLLSIDRLVKALFPDEELKLIHRLDKDTSGVLLFARGRKAAAYLSAAFAERRVEKLYWAVVCGVPKVKQGTIVSYFDGDLSAKVGHVTDMNGEIKLQLNLVPSCSNPVSKIDEPKNSSLRKAITDFSLIDSSKQKFSFLALNPKTGYKHQLRIHCSEFLNTPIVGDDEKAFGRSGLESIQRVYLHARRLEVPSPFKKDNYVFIAHLSDDLIKAWEKLGFKELA